MKLIIRDDDISYYTDWKKLDSIYKKIYGRANIVLAVIPNIGKVDGIAPKSVKPNFFRKISQATSLIDYLRPLVKKKYVKIVQHGWSHLNIDHGFELESSDIFQMFHNLSEGKKILEDTFETEIDTIVAPHDRFSKQAIQAIEAIGYSKVYRLMMPLPREIIFEIDWIKTYLKLSAFYLTRSQPMRYPTPIKFSKHLEIYCYRIEELNSSNILTLLKTHVKHKEAVFAVTAHHLTMNNQLQHTLNILVDRFYELG